jgi:hypothetical protein
LWFIQDQSQAGLWANFDHLALHRRPVCHADYPQYSPVRFSVLMLHRNAYKVLKVGKADALRREKMTFERLGSTASFMKNPHSACVRQPERILDLVHLGQDYSCFVFPPLGPNLLEFKNQLSKQSFGLLRAQIAASYMLLALDPVHSAGFIHTGKQTYESLLRTAVLICNRYETRQLPDHDPRPGRCIP